MCEHNSSDGVYICTALVHILLKCSEIFYMNTIHGFMEKQYKKRLILVTFKLKQIRSFIAHLLWVSLLYQFFTCIYTMYVLNSCLIVLIVADYNAITIISAAKTRPCILHLEPGRKCRVHFPCNSQAIFFKEGLQMRLL